MSSVERYRERIAPVLRDADGAHYLHGAGGNHPLVSDGFPGLVASGRRGRIEYNVRLDMAPNEYRQTASGGIRVHAAMTNIDGTHPSYCEGRPLAVQGLRAPVPASIVRDAGQLEAFTNRESPGNWLWPRMSQGQPVFAEACQGKRHFDCIGLVNWLMWRIFGTTSITDIVHCQRRARIEAGQHPELAFHPQFQFQTGDLLIFNVNHIGFALDERRMMEAQGELRGVLEGPIRRQGVTDVLRPTVEILGGLFNAHWRG